MMVSAVSLSALVLLAISSSSYAQTCSACPPGYNLTEVPGFSPLCLRFRATPATFGQSRNFCRQTGGNLVAFGNDAEIDAAFAFALPGLNFWTAGRQSTSDPTKWVWPDGSDIIPELFSPLSASSGTCVFAVNAPNDLNDGLRRGSCTSPLRAAMCEAPVATETCTSVPGLCFGECVPFGQGGCTCTPIGGCPIGGCNDLNACTQDSCDPITQQCVHTQIVCDDNTACTVDFCDAGVGCRFELVECVSNNECITASCDAVQGCQFQAANCNDNNPCTVDSCSALNGCENTELVCEDNNVCTFDQCSRFTGQCIYTPITVCEDLNPCTNNVCNRVTGVCQFPRILPPPPGCP